MTVTTVASGPSCSATRSAATTFPPEDVQAKMPPSRASLWLIAIASSDETRSVASTSAGAQAFYFGASEPLIDGGGTGLVDFDRIRESGS